MVAEETPESAAPAAGTATSPAPAAEPATSAAPEAHRTVDLTLGAWRPREAATQLAAVRGHRPRSGSFARCGDIARHGRTARHRYRRGRRPDRRPCP